eukprot:gene1713-4834_t
MAQQQTSSASELSHLYGMNIQMMNHPHFTGNRNVQPHFIFPQSQPFVTQGKLDAVGALFYGLSFTLADSFLYFKPFLSEYHMGAPASMQPMGGGIHSIAPAALLSQEDMNRFTTMPQMQKKTPRKGNIETQEDEFAQNVPEMSATQAELPPTKQPKSVCSVNKNSIVLEWLTTDVYSYPSLRSQKKPKQTGQEGRKQKVPKSTTRKDATVKSGSTDRSKYQTPAKPSQRKSSSAATATTSSSVSLSTPKLSEPSLKELLSKYIRDRPAISSILYGSNDHMKIWKESGVPGHYARPSDVQAKGRPYSTFDEIIADPKIKARYTTEARIRQQAIAKQFQSIRADDGDTANRIKDLCYTLKQDLKRSKSLQEESSDMLSSCIEQLKNYNTQKTCDTLERCQRSYEKLTNSHQRSITSMINKHSNKRPGR